MLHIPDTHQAKTHPSILIEDSRLPLVKCTRILEVYLDPSLSFNKHRQYVAVRVSARNNILKALAGTSWGQQNETLLMTYKAFGRSIINYAAPTTENFNVHRTRLWGSPLAVTRCSVSITYTQKQSHPITTRATPERQMEETLYTRHRNTVEPMMVKKDKKVTLQAFHTDAVDKAVKGHERNVVLDGRPPPISSSERDLTRKERSTLAQIRSWYCKLMGSNKSIIKKDASLNVCADCGTTPQDVKHLFVCPAHPTTLYRQIYGADRRTLSGNSAISRRDTQIELNRDWKANNNNKAITFDGSQVSSSKQIVNFQPTVHHFKAGQTHFFPGDPISI